MGFTEFMELKIEENNIVAPQGDWIVVFTNKGKDSILAWIAAKPAVGDQMFKDGKVTSKLLGMGGPIHLKIQAMDKTSNPSRKRKNQQNMSNRRKPNQTRETGGTPAKTRKQTNTKKKTPL